MTSSRINNLIYDTKVVRTTLGGLTKRRKMVVQQGGTSSGKTFGVLIALYLYAISQEESQLISVVGCTLPHLRRGALRQWLTICEEMAFDGDFNKTNLTFRLGKCTIEFFSADDNNKVRGGKRDVLFVNEANLINYERYRQLAIRTEQTEIIDFNPVGEFWFHEKIVPFQDDFLFRITTYKDNPTVSEKVKADIERLMRERRHIATDKEDDFHVGDMQEIVDTLTSSTRVLTGLLGAVAAVSLLVGGIGIMNIMLVSVTERTREIGTRLTIGALEREVLMQFLVEAVVLSSFGGLCGIMLGLSAAALGANSLAVPFVFKPGIVLIAFAFSSAVGVIFGYFPARKAAHLDPIEALRHE